MIPAFILAIIAFELSVPIILTLAITLSCIVFSVFVLAVVTVTFLIGEWVLSPIKTLIGRIRR